MPYFNPGGHNWGPPNRDGWGITLIVFTIAYSVCFYAACLLLWRRRKHPVVRMRKISLTLTSVLILHVYILLILLVYPINGSVPCDLEFWVMSIYLPVGIGLFQAQNQQLLIVSREQKIAINKEVFKPLPPGRPGPKQWWIRLQIWCTGARKQQAFEGLVAVGIVVQGPVNCLAKRMDLHSWALPSLEDPLIPGLIIMSSMAVIFPNVQVYLYNKAKKETLKFFKRFDTRQSNPLSRTNRNWSSVQALEECLENNPEPLLCYASEKELAGENIRFLLKVPKFRKAAADYSQRRMFYEAAKIYTMFVSSETANPELNVSSAIYVQLKKLFGEASKHIATRRPKAHVTSQVAPFEDGSHDQDASRDKKFRDKVKYLYDDCRELILVELKMGAWATISIPAGFNEFCFDAAEKSVKETVHLTTWQKYNNRIMSISTTAV
ncbi:MAG: hypothetical protein Q9167_002323 [Letrouitia subvulpina]